MKKVFKLRDLDCANCAAKMEAAIQKIHGVESATVNFMTQKLTIEAADSEPCLKFIMRKMTKPLANL